MAGSPQLIAVTVEIREPGNAGTVIRIADAMGAAAVILAGRSVDPCNGKCLRASTGSIFAIPVVVAPDVGAAIADLRAAGLQVLATAVDGEMALDDADRLLAEPTAWLFGPKHTGCRPRSRLGGPPRTHPDVGRGGEPQRRGRAAICLYESARALGRR